MAHGDKTSAIVVGPPIDPDEAEQLASSFVPVWRFGEAPFAAGNALSNEDIEALEAFAATAMGTTPSTRPTAPPPSPTAPPPSSTAPPPPASADMPLPTTQRFVALEADPFARIRDDGPIPQPQSAPLEAPLVALAASAPAAAEFAAEPAAELYGFEEPKVVRRPSKGLLLGAGAGLAAILALLVVAFHRTESPAPPTAAVQTSQGMSAPEGIPIPPPPPLADPIEPRPAVVHAAPPPSASPPEPPTAPRPQRASADPAPARSPEPTHAPRSASPPTKSASDPGPVKSNPKPAPGRAAAVPDFGI